MSRRVRDRLSRPDQLLLTRSAGAPPAALVVVDALTPSLTAAVVTPALRLAESISIGTLIPSSLLAGLPASLRVEVERADADAAVPAVVLSATPHLYAGRVALAWAHRQRVRYVVVQHGALTPFSPPLPADADLLAWSESDASLWTDKRADISCCVTGSQLLWEARCTGSAPSQAADNPPVFLGQLHGAELPRHVTRRTVEELAAATPLVYRPHPAEHDWRSRLQHRHWRRAGLAIDDQGLPISRLGVPLIGIFSTALLEAAAAGLPAWGACSPPVSWVREFWDRYGIPEWGSRPSTSMAQPLQEQEPARAIADLIASHV